MVLAVYVVEDNPEVWTWGHQDYWLGKDTRINWRYHHRLGAYDILSQEAIFRNYSEWIDCDL